jgi:hypothetical protein
MRAALSAPTGCGGAHRVRWPRFLSTIMQFRRGQIGHCHDRGEKMHLWLRCVSKIMAMSILSCAILHDRGEKTLIAHRWGAMALVGCPYARHERIE